MTSVWARHGVPHHRVYANPETGGGRFLPELAGSKLMNASRQSNPFSAWHPIGVQQCLDTGEYFQP